MELYTITSRFEINVLESNVNPITAADWAQKHRCPAVVVGPQHVAPLMANRAAKSGQYHIIAALDFPKGSHFAMDKLRIAGQDFSVCDGVDVLLTGGRTQVETRNEIKALYEFLRAMNMYEIRYVLGAYTRSREELVNMLVGMKQFPPRWIRLDQHMRKPNVATGHHKGMAELFKLHMPTPLKVGCNVDWDTVKALRDTKFRFDVTLDQAIGIVKDYEKEEREKAEQKRLDLAAVAEKAIKEADKVQLHDAD